MDEICTQNFKFTRELLKLGKCAHGRPINLECCDSEPMVIRRTRSAQRGDILLRLVLISGRSCDLSIKDCTATVGELISAVLYEWPETWAAEVDQCTVRSMHILHQGRYLSDDMVLDNLNLPRDQFVTMHVALRMKRGPTRHHASGEFCPAGVVDGGRCRHRGESRASITLIGSTASLGSGSFARSNKRHYGSYTYVSRRESANCGCLPGCIIM